MYVESHSHAFSRGNFRGTAQSGLSQPQCHRGGGWGRRSAAPHTIQLEKDAPWCDWLLIKCDRKIFAKELGKSAGIRHHTALLGRSFPTRTCKLVLVNWWTFRLIILPAAVKVNIYVEMLYFLLISELFWTFSACWPSSFSFRQQHSEWSSYTHGSFILLGNRINYHHNKCLLSSSVGVCVYKCVLVRVCLWEAVWVSDIWWEDSCTGWGYPKSSLQLKIYNFVNECVISVSIFWWLNALKHWKVWIYCRCSLLLRDLSSRLGHTCPVDTSKAA